MSSPENRLSGTLTPASEDTADSWKITGNFRARRLLVGPGLDAVFRLRRDFFPPGANAYAADMCSGSRISVGAAIVVKDTLLIKQANPSPEDIMTKHAGVKKSRNGTKL